jgi:hypothetical protein
VKLAPAVKSPVPASKGAGLACVDLAVLVHGARGAVVEHESGHGSAARVEQGISGCVGLEEEDVDVAGPDRLAASLGEQRHDVQRGGLEALVGLPLPQVGHRHCRKDGDDGHHYEQL